MIVDRVPRLPELDADKTEKEQLSIVLSHHADMYSYVLKLLISAKETGFFIDGSLNKNIRYCTEAVNWIDSLTE